MFCHDLILLTYQTLGRQINKTRFKSLASTLRIVVLTAEKHGTNSNVTRSLPWIKEGSCAISGYKSFVTFSKNECLCGNSFHFVGFYSIRRNQILTHGEACSLKSGDLTARP